MKLKKMFAGLVASALAVSTMASMAAFEASAVSKINTDIILAENFSLAAWGSKWCQTSDSQLRYDGVDTATVEVKFTCADAASKWDDFEVFSIADSGWLKGSTTKTEYTLTYDVTVTLDQYNQLGFNVQAGQASVEVESVKIIAINGDITVPTTDVWVDNGGGSYSYTAEAKEQDYSKNLDTGISVPAGATLTATVSSNGYAKIAAGSNSGSDWSSATDQVFDNTTGTFTWTAENTLDNVQFYPAWVNKGVKVTISNIKVEKATVTFDSSTVDKVATQKSDVTDGKYNVRAIYTLDKSKVEDYSAVKFTFKLTQNGSEIERSGSAKEYYTGIVDDAANTYVVADDVVVVIATLTGVPEDVTFNSCSCATVAVS